MKAIGKGLMLGLIAVSVLSGANTQASEVHADVNAARTAVNLARDRLIKDSQGEQQRVAIMLAAGELTTQLTAWTESLDQRDQQHIALVFGMAQHQLAQLAQAGGWVEATRCHFKEANTLLAAAQGKTAKPPFCRQKVYQELLSKSSSEVMEASKPQARAKTLDWVGATMSFAHAQWQVVIAEE